MVFLEIISNQVNQPIIKNHVECVSSSSSCSSSGRKYSLDVHLSLRISTNLDNVNAILKPYNIRPGAPRDCVYIRCTRRKVHGFLSGTLSHI